MRRYTRYARVRRGRNHLLDTVFYGYICPFGSFQEWIGKSGQKLFPKKYKGFEISPASGFDLGIAITSLTGLWQTKTTKTPSKLENARYSDEYDPADILGSYTFSDISRTSGVPLGNQSAAFGVGEAATSDFKCKDQECIYGESQYEIGTASVKMFTAYCLGLSYEPEEETYLPDTAAKILIEKGNMTQEQRDDLKGHTVPEG